MPDTQLDYNELRDESIDIIAEVYDKEKRIDLAKQFKKCKDLNSLKSFKLILDEETKFDLFLFKNDIGVILAQDLGRLEDAGKLFLLHDFKSLNLILAQPDIETIFIFNYIVQEKKSNILNAEDKDELIRKLKTEEISITLKRLEDLKDIAGLF